MTEAEAKPTGKLCRASHPEYVVGCRICWLAEYDQRHRTKWGIPGPPAVRGKYPPKARPERHELPCVHEGAVLEWCKTCTGAKSESRHVRDCDLHDRCTRGRTGGVVRACVSCPDYKPDYGIDASPPGVVVKDGLTTNLSGYAFNASIIRWKDRLLMAYRDGWRGSNIHIADLDESYRVTGTRVVEGLFRKESNYGREDPRLFVHDGRLHVAYIGVHGNRANDIWTYQCFARLRDDFSAEQTFSPRAPGSKDWEKNWGFFSHDGTLHAVYRIAPHRILKFDRDGGAEFVHETQTPIPWNGGEMRGGAAPVRVGDEYWHFFHDRIEVAGLRIYRTGLYTFDASPPFSVRRFVPQPILTANPETNPGNYAAVLFTCGAVKDGETWKLSSGIHDRWIEIHKFDHADLEKRLVKA